jgi:hypothetical protein
MTDFTKVCEILGTLYANYKEDEEFKDFVDFNDLGLPLAYFVAENLCQVSDDGARYITETWQLFLASLNIDDTGYEGLDQMLSIASGEELDDDND